MMICNNIPSSPASGRITLKQDIKRISNSSHWKNDGKVRMCPLLMSYFSGCKNKRIKQKMNLAASQLFVILVSGLFGMDLSYITKKTSFRCCRGVRSTSLFSISNERVWFIHLFKRYCSLLYGRLTAHVCRSV